ncbi:MAG: GTP 3',8-cyclase MoaA, partial [Deltaproteobacteria bacterium]|nr:GTP 3',8-cyclase MoaA [Deltaproteobacteria bacterium]
RYRFAGAKGEIGFISPLTDHFCNKCNRLRLTASGLLRPCLLSDYQEDLKGPLRSGCLDSDLVDVILRVVHNKPFEHGVGCSRHDKVSGQMSSIGG